MKITDIGNFYLYAFAIIPGVVTIYFRSKFITGIMPKFTEAIPELLVLSVLNFFVCSYLIYDLTNKNWTNNVFIFYVLWFFVLFIFPSVIGILAGLFARHSIARKTLNYLGFGKLGLVSHVVCYPTSWDYLFGKLVDSPVFVVVTLKNGNRIHGYYGERSYTSSSPGDNRDVYLQEVYSIDDNGQWAEIPGSYGAWIPGGEIGLIELKQPPKEEDNERHKATTQTTTQSGVQQASI